MNLEGGGIYKRQAGQFKKVIGGGKKYIKIVILTL